MDFGRLPVEDLDKINFQLPEDSAFSKEILKPQKKKTPKVYIGCAKWGRKEWVGKVYPEGTKESNFLEHYVKHFNSIELNATHYQLYGPSTTSKWAEKAEGKDFKFCPKVSKSISHFSSLVGPQVQALTERFLTGVRVFKENLGPIFLQVNEKFTPAKKDNLLQYLSTLPKELQFFVEVRHPDWYQDSAAFFRVTVAEYRCYYHRYSRPQGLRAHAAYGANGFYQVCRQQPAPDRFFKT